jgi:hypothetical protein
MLADQGFASQGWGAGGIYRFDVYNDDRWKTVNGHVNKTPIATYFDALQRLPYTFVEMARANILLLVFKPRDPTRG